MTLARSRPVKANSRVMAIVSLNGMGGRLPVDTVA